MNPGPADGVVNTAPAGSSQKGRHVEPEIRGQEEGWPVVYRPPPEEFWRSVEGRALSGSELEGVLDRVTEEEAEHYLRDKGMIDSDGKLKPPSSRDLDG